jgi:hypothetical protein
MQQRGKKHSGEYDDPPSLEERSEINTMSDDDWLASAMRLINNRKARDMIEEAIL